MLYLFLITNILILVCATIGIGMLNYVEKYEQSFTRWGDRLIIATWLGIIGWCISLLTIAFLLPLSPLVGITTALILIVLCSLSKKNRQEIFSWKKQLTLQRIILMITVTVISAAIMSNYVNWLDTGLYHLGSIHWLKEYGIVPGLGLIHGRFGFVSSWFALSAILHTNFLGFGFRLSMQANCLVLALVFIQLVIATKYIIEGKARIYDWFIAILLFITLPILTLGFFHTILVSPSPDIPVIVLTEVIAWCILYLSSNSGDQNWLNSSLIPLILSIGVVTIKLSGLPLLIISYFFYLFNQKFNYQKLIMGIVISIILISPILIAGILITGCPIYPSKLMCLDLPWSIPVKNIQREMSHINFAKQLSLNLWLKEKTNQFMVFMIIISLIFIGLIGKYLWKKMTKLNYRFSCICIIGLAFLGILFFIQSPMLRFVLPYLIMIPVLVLAVLFDEFHASTKIYLLFQSQISRLKSVFRSKQNFLLVNLALSLTIIILVNNNPQKGLLLPPVNFQNRPILLRSEVNDIQYVYPIVNAQNRLSSFCWESELPCALGGDLKNIKLRDPVKGIDGGFVNVK